MPEIRKFRGAAVEELARHLKPITICPGQRYFIGTEEIFFKEITVVLNKRSDMVNMPIALFSRIPGDCVLVAPFNVAGAILTRCMDNKERDGREETLLIAEAIHPCSIQPKQNLSMIFELIGRKEEYVASETLG